VSVFYASSRKRAKNLNESISLFFMKHGLTFPMILCRYAQYGDVSPKVDVYALGVVLYELISAKEAIVKSNGSSAESRGLVALVNFLPFLFISINFWMLIDVLNLL
jgi:serine/threonine protein kinase